MSLVSPGGGFPGGSEADLNVELTINASVQGWPAIQDIGIPAGASNPIYDKTMWIADGVFYTVNGGGLDSDSLSLANSSVTLYPQQAAPVETQPVPEVPVNQVPANSAPVNNTGVSTSPTGEPVTQSPAGNSPTGSTTTTSTTTDITTETGSTSSETVAPTPTPSGSSDGTSGAWFTGGLTADPSDGTDGALPPFLGDDGTGGAP